MMSLVIKNKMLNEKLEQSDKTITKLMSKITEYEDTIFKLKQDNEYLLESVTYRECNLGIKNDLLMKKNEQLTNKLKQCERISNNVLYFDDNSDYVTALWQILNVTQDRKVDDDCYDIKLKYMEEE